MSQKPRMVSKAFIFVVLCGVLVAEETPAPVQQGDDFESVAKRLRVKTLNAVESKVAVTRVPDAPEHSRYPWKMKIVTALFFVGEGGAKASAWDADWASNFGGFDNPDPSSRRNFMPVAFIPNQNPFYVALPYNDLARGTHKPEAKKVIPWFAEEFEREGKSVCQNRWIAIRKDNRVCYAQWSDVGPHRSDHWQYVFGNERPKPSENRGAGLSVSPSVRDYLGMTDSDVVDWKFVDLRDVPPGPWARIGANNTKTRSREFVTSPSSTPTDLRGSFSPHTPPPKDMRQR